MKLNNALQCSEIEIQPCFYSIFSEISKDALMLLDCSYQNLDLQ